MSTEDRLRDALHAEASRVQPPDRWAEIESRVLAPSRARPNRLAILSAAAAVAVVAASIALVSRNDDPDTQPVLTDTSTTSGPVTTNTSAAVAPTTIATPPATTIPVSGPPSYVWPFDNKTTYSTPIKLADAFARDFLGMPDPRIGSYRAGDNRSGEINVHPSATGTIGTTLSVRQDAVGWHVVTAESANIELDAPAAAAHIASPVHLTGRSITFEATVRVAVLRFGTTMRCVQPTDSCGSDPGVLANTFFTGGGGTEKMPFSTNVTFNRSSTRYGLVVLFTDSPENGTLAEATVRLVRFS